MGHKMHSIVTIESIDSDLNFSTNKNVSYIDNIRVFFNFLLPYFSVSSTKLPRRIFSSLVPPFFFPEFRRVYSDLKGPLLILITLFFIILYGLNFHDTHLAFNLLTAIKLSFGYWAFFAVLAFFLGYFCQTCLTLSQYFSISGYSLSGHCLVLVIAEIIQQEGSDAVFFFLMILFGGLTTSRMIIILMARTSLPVGRFLICTVLTTVHLMHLIHIHFVYMRKRFSLA